MTVLTDFLQWTTWPMTSPALYGPFHLIFALGGSAAAIGLAWLTRRRSFSARMALMGTLLLSGEIYKQLFFYFILNDQSYDWWIFPFQLCSLPIYICPLLPFIHNEKRHRILCTFLLDFNMMGAAATLIDPSGIFHGYWTLTLHGLLWHLLLIFIGCSVLFGGFADLSWRGFARTLPMFGLFCAAAQLLNVLLHNRGSINLFYISPWEPSTQLFFSWIDQVLGRPAGVIIYMTAMIGGAALIHWAARRLSPLLKIL